MIKEKFTSAKLRKYVNHIKYFVGIKRNSNSRKKVIHNENKLNNSVRGKASSLKKDASIVKNAEIYKSLKRDHKFDILRDPFNAKKYPQEEFKKIKKYMLSDKQSDQKRVGNALVAMIKNYMDLQKLKKNKYITEKQKGFNKFSIDSRQLQKSIGWTVKLKGK